MSARQELIGQLKARSLPPPEQLAALYGSPWHTTAAVNGAFALIAVLVAAAVLLKPRLRPGKPTAPWVTAVAWGALALGVIGLLIAGAVALGLFAGVPAVPSGPSGPAQ
jgi:sterol desaturase/sphingolipid hydroxylase (fatty acid hydroxylase superfamily)